MTAIPRTARTFLTRPAAVAVPPRRRPVLCAARKRGGPAASPGRARAARGGRPEDLRRRHRPDRPADRNRRGSPRPGPRGGAVHRPRDLGTTDDCGFSPFGDDTSTSRDTALPRSVHASKGPGWRLASWASDMARDEERLARSQQEPLVGGLPDVPGILTALGSRLPSGSTCAASPTSCSWTTSRARRSAGHSARCSPGRVRGQQLLLLHGLARGVRRRPARALRGVELLPLVDEIKKGHRTARPEDAGTPAHRADRSPRAAGPDRREVPPHGKPAHPTRTSSSRCSLPPRSRCTTGSSKGSAPGPRRLPRPTGHEPTRSPTMATATGASPVWQPLLGPARLSTIADPAEPPFL